jgi:hypothetical protein
MTRPIGCVLHLCISAVQSTNDFHKNEVGCGHSLEELQHHHI